MKKSLRLTSLALTLAMVLLLFLPIISSANNERKITINVHGPKEVIDKMVMKSEGFDIKNKTTEVNITANVEISNINEQGYELYKKLPNGRIKYISKGTDIFETDGIIKDHDVIDLYLLNEYKNIFVDSISKDEREINFYGIPGMEFNYYKFRETEFSEVKKGKFDINGKAVIDLETPLRMGEGVEVYAIDGDDLYLSYGGNEFTLNDLKLDEEKIYAGNEYIKGKVNSRFQLKIIDTVNKKTINYDIIPNKDGHFYINTEKIKATDIIIARIYGPDAVSKFIKLNINTKELDSVKRVSGGDRYKTSVETSKFTLPSGSKYAIVASGEVFADALVGGTLATQIKAPILLTEKDSLSKDIKDEITRLGAKEIYLLGGENTVSENVKKEIEKLDIKVERLAGHSRFETADEIAKARAKHLGHKTSVDHIANIDAHNFADALSAAPFIGQIRNNINGGDTITSLIPYQYPMKSIIVIGGTNSVPFTNEKYRIAGQNRYETSVEVAKAYKTHLNKDIDTVVLVDGTNYPDALSSSLVSSENNGAILLTPPKGLTNEVQQFINENKNIKNIIIVGGEKSVSKTIEDQLRSFVK